MNKTMKRVLAGIASAALALTGLVGGAATANADQGTLVDGNKTLTFTATEEQQLANATLKVYKIADYVQYGTDPNIQYGLQTTDGAKSAVTAVIESITKPGSTDKYSVPTGADPLAWAQSQKIFLSEETGTTDSTERKLADGLAALAQSKGTDLTLGTTTQKSDGTYQRTASVKAGLYVIIDESPTNPSVPMIVDTAPWNNANGTINMKNSQTPTGITKQIAGSQSASADLGENGKKTATLKVKMPEIANYSQYDFDIYDFADPGMTIDTATIKVTATVGSGDDAQTVTAGDSVSTINRAKDSDGNYTEDVTGEKTAVTGDYDGNAGTALAISLDYAQLKALKDNGVKTGDTLTITYDVWLNKSVLLNDKTGAVKTATTSGLVHSAKNSVRVSANGTMSAVAADAQTASLSTSDFSFSKVWADGSPATGAQFTVSKTVNGNPEYLLAQDATTKAWSWTADQTKAQKFDATDDTKDTTDKNFYTFQGLADGDYTVTEATVATTANHAFTPSFTVTITHGASTPAVATPNDVWGLVRQGTTGDKTNTNGVAPIAVVTNVHEITELPKTGAAGIILAVAIALLLFAGAFVLVSIYRRKAAARR